MITLHNISGTALKSGQDSHGNMYIEFVADYYADQTDGDCVECGKVIATGWLCLDGGEEYCYEHIRLACELDG